MVNRRQLLALAVVDLVLLLIAELTYPGTVSDIAWVAFLIGAAALIVNAVVALVRRRRMVP